MMNFFGWAAIKVETMGWIVDGCMTQRLLIRYSIHHHISLMKQETHNFLSPKAHLRIIKTVVVVMTTHATDKAMSVVHFTLCISLKLLVGFQLGITVLVSRRNILLLPPFVQFTQSTGFTLPKMEVSLAHYTYRTLTISLISRETGCMRALYAC